MTIQAELIGKYKVLSEDTEKLISRLTKKYLSNSVDIDRSDKATRSEPDIKPAAAVKIGISCNKTYCIRLLKELEKIKDILPPKNYTNLGSAVNKLIKNDNFDDAEEISASVHSAVEKYVYGAFGKVKNDKRDYLRTFLKAVGYKKVEIPNGANIRDWLKYFSKTFDEKTEDIKKIEKIKEIVREPYEITFAEVDEAHILEGQCIYYKKA